MEPRPSFVRRSRLWILLAGGGALLLTACIVWSARSRCSSPALRAAACLTADGRSVGLFGADQMCIVDAASGAIRSCEKRREGWFVSCLGSSPTQVERRPPAEDVGSLDWAYEGRDLLDDAPRPAGARGEVVVWNLTKLVPSGRRGSVPVVERRVVSLHTGSSEIRRPLTRDDFVIDVDERARVLVSGADALRWLDLRTGAHEAARLDPSPCGVPAHVNDDATRALWLCGDMLTLTDVPARRKLYDLQIPDGLVRGQPSLSPDGRRAYVVRRLTFPRAIIIGVREDGSRMYTIQLDEMPPVVIPLPDRDVLLLGDDGRLVRRADANGQIVWTADPTAEN